MPTWTKNATVVAVVVLAILAVGVFWRLAAPGPRQTPPSASPEAPMPAAPAVPAVGPTPMVPTETAAPPTIQPAPSPLAEPLAGAAERITAKPFGLEVSPGHSPVTPERFSGFHTGVDFETGPDEQGIEVAVRAVCEGRLLVKRRASGYGGVAVQSCRINGQAVTVVYGHLKLSSIGPAVGDTLVAGQILGVLGQGYSAETDGERKHLHLGIHLGETVDIRGYVKTRAELSQWLDPAAMGGWRR